MTMNHELPTSKCTRPQGHSDLCFLRGYRAFAQPSPPLRLVTRAFALKLKIIDFLL